MSKKLYSIKQSVAAASLCLISELSYGFVSCQEGMDYKNSCNPYNIKFHNVNVKNLSEKSNQVAFNKVENIIKINRSKSYFDSLLDRYRDSYHADYGFQSLIDRSAYSSLATKEDNNSNIVAIKVKEKPKSKPKPIEVVYTAKDKQKTQHKSIKFENKLISKTTKTTKSLENSKITKASDNKDATLSRKEAKVENNIKSIAKSAIKKLKIAKDINKTLKVAKKSKNFLDNNFTFYTVKKGDSLIKIAKKFSLKKRVLVKLNGLEKNNTIKIGQKLKLPITTKFAKSIENSKVKKVAQSLNLANKDFYVVKKGDTLFSIAKKTNKSITLLREINKLSRSSHIVVGEKIYLNPVKFAKRENRNFDFIRNIKFRKVPALKYRRKIRVTATAYTSHHRQTDKTPFLAAWNNRLKPGMKIIAVSPDLIKKYGLTNGVKVKIMGLSGYYVVRDKMNKRWRNRIDIYMGVNKRRALNWGRRKIVLYW